MVGDFDMAPPAVRLVVESAARAMQDREYVRLRCSFDAKRCAANDTDD
ncbi:bacteriophage protein [Burkholderia pseudomallei]|nr:bacteriophage protein [Burkholderia pseudomallei]